VISENANNSKLLIEYINKNIRKRDRVISSNIALLIIDMQKYFCDRSSYAYVQDTPQIIENINRLSKVFSQRSLPVISTKHINKAGSSGMMDKWWRDVITLDSPLSKFDERIKTDGNYIIEKSQYDAFYRTDLLELLESLNIHQIVISGVLTHLCCETTARSAFVNGFEVFFVVDATATYNNIHHNCSIINLAHGFAHPVLTDDLINDIGDLK
jgi:isochorismate hydrolase